MINGPREKPTASIIFNGERLNTLTLWSDTALMTDIHCSVKKAECRRTDVLNCDVGENSWESLGLQGDPTSPFWRRWALGFLWREWCWSWNSSPLATSGEELTHWKRLWCWEGLGAGGGGDDRGWDGWMASLTRWTWVWVNSGSWWWTGRPGVLQFMGLQRVGHDWATKLNWTELIHCSKVLAREIKEEKYIRHPNGKRLSKTVSTYKRHDYIYWKSQINMKKLPVLINKLSETWCYKISVQKSLVFHSSEKSGKEIKKTILLTIVLCRKLDMNNEGWPRQNGCKIICKPHFRHAQSSPRELTYFIQKLWQRFFPSPSYIP